MHVYIACVQAIVKNTINTYACIHLNRALADIQTKIYRQRYIDIDRWVDGLTDRVTDRRTVINPVITSK